MIQRLLSRWLLCMLALISFAVPVTRVQAAELPKGWSSYPVSDITFGLPPAWKNIPLTKKALQATADAAKKSNPELASLLQNIIDSGQLQLLKFFAIEQASGQNINIIPIAVGLQLKPKDIADLLAKQLSQSLPNAKIIETRADITLNGLAAARVIYDLPITRANGKADVLRGYQYYLPIDTTIYVISMTGDSSKAFKSLAEQIAGTIDRVPTTPSGTTALVKTAGNLRAGPSTSANIIEKLAAKEKLGVLGKNKAGTWLKVSTPRGKTGWVSLTLLSIDSAVYKQLKVLN